MNGEYLQPVENDGAAGTHVEVRKQREACGSANGHVRYPAFGTFLEDAGSTTGQSQGVERARREVEERIPRTPRRSDDDGVDDTRQDRDTGILDTDDESRRSGAGTAAGQGVGVGGADDTYGQDAADIEDDEAVKVTPGRFWQVAARGFHLAAGDDDELRGEGEGESTEDEGTEESAETASVACFEVGVDGAAVF